MSIKRRAERAIYLGRGERSEQYTLISHPPGTGDLISHPPGTGDLSSGLSGPGAAVTVTKRDYESYIIKTSYKSH